MKWIEIKSELDLNKIVEESFFDNIGVAIFKHSTRCSISSVAKMRLSSFWNFNEELPLYYLDIMAFREISNLVEEKFSIRHESPQLIVIKEGKCIYDASHLAISVKSLRSKLEITN